MTEKGKNDFKLIQCIFNKQSKNICVIYFDCTCHSLDKRTAKGMCLEL